jgi:hypothetical protein
MKYWHTFVEFEEGTLEILDKAEDRLKPHTRCELVSLAMWLGPPLLSGFRLQKTRQLPEGAAA